MNKFKWLIPGFKLPCLQPVLCWAQYPRDVRRKACFILPILQAEGIGNMSAKQL